MRKPSAIPVLVIFAFSASHAGAVELLTGGDFEFPAGEIPGWKLQEFATGTNTILNTAEQIDFDPASGVLDLWLRPFEGGEEVGPDNLTNAILSQIVPAEEGKSYSLIGFSRWEFNYSGGVAELDGGPLGGQSPPTRDRMELAFLDAGGSIIDAPIARNLIDDRGGFPNDNQWVRHDLMGTAPDGTASIRVTAEARDMVWNGAFDDGQQQSAFLDAFSLSADDASGTELLANPDLEELPQAFASEWVVTNVPEESDEIVQGAAFAQNENTDGAQGVWLSSFLGETSDPVDGSVAQTVPAVAGGSYTFTGWSRFETNFSGGVEGLPTQTLLELAFLDESDETIGDPSVLDVKADRTTQSPTNEPNDSAWYQHTLADVTAPEGAVNVRVSGIMLDGVNSDANPQSAFFDDFSLDGPSTGVIVGDLNGDGEVNFGDLSPFALGLTDIPAYNAAFPALVDTRVERGDVNLDEAFNFGDLTPFVDLLTGGGAGSGTAVPEPASALLWCGLAVVAMWWRRDRSRN